MKALLSLLLLAATSLTVAESRAQSGAVGIGTTAPQSQLHTTAGVRHDTLSGTGARMVFADEQGRLFAPRSLSNVALVSIPDNSCSGTGATSSINVTGLPAAVPSVNIKVQVNFEAQQLQDLQVYLLSPNGNTLRLISNNGGYAQYLTNTTFWDGAAATLPANGTGAPFTGTYKPTGGLSAVCGVTPDVAGLSSIGGGSIVPNGKWTLLMFDDQQYGGAALLNWAISFDGSTPAVNNTFATNMLQKGAGGVLTNSSIYENNGYTGLGTSTPELKLDVRGGNIGMRHADSSNHLYLAHGGSNAYIFAGGAEDGLTLSVAGGSGSYGWQNYRNVMNLHPNGNVGIGNNYPHAPLQLANSFANRKLVLYESWNDDHQFMGFGVGGGFLRYQVPGAGDDHIFFSGNGASASAELMRITGDGYVGIGTTLPGQKAKVEIHGGAWSTPTVYRYMNGSSDGNTTNSTPNYYSLYTAERIWCNGEINVTSDLRTKERVASSLPAADLALINRLRVVDYNYVDRAAKGDTRVKGFLAQEVEAIMPEAVMRNTGVVPNIYRKAEGVWYDAAASTLAIAMTTAHGVEVGDTVKLITNDGDKLVPVVAVEDSLHFSIGDWTTATDWVFVYGTQVHDLRNLDYNKIFSAGISAIQELSRGVNSLEKRMAAAENNATDAKRELAELRASVERLVKSSSTVQR